MVQRKQTWAKSLTGAVNLATNVAAVLAIGLFGGRWLDARYNAGGYLFTMLGFVLGVFTAGKILWDQLMKDSSTKDIDDKKSDQGQK
jgi:uncharacterized protein YneF (UPF0154 family)